jgi:hypothetical protein
MFRVQTAAKDAVEKFVARKEKEHAKLNRELTQAEHDQEMKEFRELPTELEAIEVLYRKEPTEELINLVSYTKQLIE